MPGCVSIQCGWFGETEGVKLFDIFQRGQEITVGCFVMYLQKKGFVFIPVIEPFYGFVSYHICGITMMGAGVAFHGNKPGFKIKTLAGQYLPVVITYGI